MNKKVKSIFALILVLTMNFILLVPVYAVNSGKAETQASALKQLRLFKGVSAVDFDLDRVPTRTEAVIMLIRVLGQEQEALNGGFAHPFTDVEPWADKYIGYAYEKGLTKGVSATEYGIGSASSDMYLTFMLRALGYSDSAGDFAWDAPDTLATSVGILPSSVDTGVFLRADAALVSWEALKAKLKDGNQTLSEKLIGMKIFNPEEYESAKLFVEKGGGNVVSTFTEFQEAVNNKNITVIQIRSDMDISEELLIDREDNPKAEVYIKEGVTLTISSEFILVGCFVTNDGTIIINGTFDRGLNSLTNNGTVTVKSGGTFCSGMTDTYNYGTAAVESGGSLLVERGTQFYNYGSLGNDGYISVDNGGCLYNDTGKIENNGVIDLNSYFSGGIAEITGTGTINDNRQ